MNKSAGNKVSGVVCAVAMAVVMVGCAGGPTKPSSFPPSQRPVAAVLDFEYKASATAFADTAAGLAESVTAALASTGRVKLVERSRLKAVLAEATLGLTGAVDPSTAAKMGQLTGAEYLITGSITRIAIRDEFRSVVVATKTERIVDIEAEARMIEVKTGLLVASARAVNHAEGAEKHLIGAKPGLVPAAEAIVQNAMIGLGEKLAYELAGSIEPKDK